MSESNWYDLGPVEEFKQTRLRSVKAGKTSLAITHANGAISVVSGVCNHAGGPICEGQLDGEYLVCPWHHWKYHCRTGEGEPGFEADRLPTYASKVEDGHLWVDLTPKTERQKGSHAEHPLARPVKREAGPIRVLGLSTTAMDPAYPRYSTSDAVLASALAGAAEMGCETKLIRLNDLKFRACEGYYSKSARACTWPCSITQMDPQDELEQVYEAVVHWADAIIVATPIRWGAASSLYYRLAERMNCIQNQITIHDRVLIQNKTAAFIITGGQDNIQAVAGQMMGFFGELGFVLPQFPYVAHSRGWSAEDMERNVAYVMNSEELHEGAKALVERAVELAKRLIEEAPTPARIARGGRKAHCEMGANASEAE